jgi:hypothetical protein
MAKEMTDQRGNRVIPLSDFRTFTNDATPMRERMSGP